MKEVTFEQSLEDEGASSGERENNLDTGITTRRNSPHRTKRGWWALVTSCPPPAPGIVPETQLSLIFTTTDPF